MWNTIDIYILKKRYNLSKGICILWKRDENEKTYNEYKLIMEHKKNHIRTCS